jgi:hypothetical protein
MPKVYPQTFLCESVLLSNLRVKACWKRASPKSVEFYTLVPATLGNLAVGVLVTVRYYMNVPATQIQHNGKGGTTAARVRL